MYTLIFFRDREVCPLVVMALWRPEADTGYDSVHCRRVFSIYASAWILKFHPRHIRTLAVCTGCPNISIHCFVTVALCSDNMS